MQPIQFLRVKASLAHFPDRRAGDVLRVMVLSAHSSTSCIGGLPGKRMSQQGNRLNRDAS
jgi:hypothetical protein